LADVNIRIQARDESRAAFDKAKGNLGGLISTAATLGPALAPVAAAATAAVVGLASALGGAAVSAGVFKLAVQPQTAAISEAAAAHEKYQEAVRQSGAGSEEAKKALEEYNSQLKNMPAATQATAKEFIGLKSDFSAWSDSLAGSTMPIFTKGIQVLRTILPTLTPIVRSTAEVLGDLMSRLQAKVESKGFETFMAKVAAWSENGLRSVVSGIETLFSKIGSFVMGEGFREFLAMGGEAGSNLGTILQKLAQFAMEFVKAAGPLAGLSFAALGVLADALNAIPQSVLEILAPMIMAIVVAMKAWHLANVIFTAGQLALNTVMMAAPWVLITLAIIALVVALVALWKKNEGFREFIKAAWKAIQDAFSAAWTFIRDKVFAPLGRFFTETIPRWATTLKDKIVGAWNSIKDFVGKALDFLKNLFLNWTGPGLIIKHWDKIREGARTVVNKVKEFWNGFMDFFRGIPGKISGAARGMWNGITSSFKGAINGIIGLWNNLSFTIGGGSILGKKLPSVTLNTPNIPYLARGGIASGLAVVGERGRELVDLPSGSRVRTNADTERILSRGSGGSRPMVVNIDIGGKPLGRLLIDPLRGEIRSLGGNVQAVLGTGR
jgi:phage-related protein